VSGTGVVSEGNVVVSVTGSPVTCSVVVKASVTSSDVVGSSVVADGVGVTVPVGPGVSDSSAGTVRVGDVVEDCDRVGVCVPPGVVPVVSAGVGDVPVASVVPVVGVGVGVVPGFLDVVEGSTDDVTIVVVAGGV